MKMWIMIWIDEVRKIASFHAVEGFVPHPLFDKAEFLSFIDSLCEKNYCFQ